MHEIMKLLGSTKNKIGNDENCENVPHLEITEIVLVHCNIFHKIQAPCIHLFLKNIWSLIKYFTKKFYIFKNF